MSRARSMTFLSAMRDLQWRRRRVIIAAVGAALVFSITLVLAGVSNGFDVETDDTMDRFGTDGWVVGEGAAGPFIGQKPLPEALVDAVRADPGITDANPVIFSRKTVGTDSPEEVNLFGAALDGVGVPAPDDGRGLEAVGEIVVSGELDYDVGDEILVSEEPFEVVGTISEWTAVAGVPNVMITIEDAQRLSFLDQPIISAIAVTGAPEALPDGVEFMSDDVAREDLLRAVENARAGINLVGFLLWIVAGTIIGSLLYLSALERMHDFAVFKATGTSSVVVLVDLVFQAVFIALVSATIGMIVAALVGPRFPTPVVIPLRSLVSLPLVAVAVGLLASLAGLRRAVTVDPAVAFNKA